MKKRAIQILFIILTIAISLSGCALERFIPNRYAGNEDMNYVIFRFIVTTLMSLGSVIGVLIAVNIYKKRSEARLIALKMLMHQQSKPSSNESNKQPAEPVKPSESIKSSSSERFFDIDSKEDEHKNKLF